LPRDEVVCVSALTGLGPIEVGVLEACDRCGAGRAAPYRKSALIVGELYDATGIGPRIGYEVLCDMARPYISHLALIDFHGNFGSVEFSPASPRYTESRLTSLGAAAHDAERGRNGALPIGLINGDTHVGGSRPPMDPRRVLAALRAAVDASDDELVDLVGLPAFPTGCAVAGDGAQVASGAPTTLALRARITATGQGELIVSNLPPDVNVATIANTIQRSVDFPNWPRRRESPHPIAEVNDQSTDALGTRLVITVRPGADLDEATELVEDIYGIHRTITVSLGGPLPELLRGWIRIHGRDDLEQQLAPIEAAIVATS
jgi:DNA gyrase/topoisomerase IV subunit A